MYSLEIVPLAKNPTFSGPRGFNIESAKSNELLFLFTSANNIGEIGLDGLMGDVAVPEGEHLPVDECHCLVVAHEHASLTPAAGHLPGVPPRATGIPSQPPGLGRDDEVSLGGVIDLSFLHELREGVVNELPARSLHRGKGVPQR